MERAKAIAHVKDMYEHMLFREDKEALETLIPELKESEDERIRKTLINALKTPKSVGELKFVLPEPTREECITYLEKQKEEEGYEAIPVESTLEYKLGFRVGKESEKQKEQPQEELVYRMNGLMQEYIKEGKDETEKEHRFKCYQLFWDALEDANFFEQKEQKPAEVDESTKRLNDNWMKQHFDDYEEQKSAQSREEILHQLFQNGSISLSDYLYLTGEQKPKQEWSEEDVDMLNSCISSIEEAKENRYAYKETDGDTSYDYEIAWLKSLRPRWRPSEEDIKMLEHIIGQYETGNKNSEVVGYLPRVEELSFLKNVLSKWKN